jgi:bleomycin hydrolase
MKYPASTNSSNAKKSPNWPIFDPVNLNAMIKKILVAFLLVICIILTLPAQELSPDRAGAVFTDKLLLPSTPVKDQSSSGTCWAYGALAMLESEMLRLNKQETDLSEMFCVYHAYMEKAVRFVRMHGNLNFGNGGTFHDVINIIREYGIVPEEVYPVSGNANQKQAEMDALLRNQVDSVVRNRDLKLSPLWQDSVVSILRSCLGTIPEKFNYQGKSYSPQSFAKDFIGLNMDDYIEVTSFTHHPFYTRFILEIPDNWSWDEVYNVPLNELEEIIDYSLVNKYTVAWATDISENGFQAGGKGMADVPEHEITQQLRQVAFDNYRTTDDHGMLIVGKATGENGNSYYKVKNSWGESNELKGWVYASKAYVLYKTTDIMVNRNGIPPHIRKKLNL